MKALIGDNVVTNIEDLIKGILFGSLALLFMCYGPIVWNVDLPDYNVLAQAVDKIDWYCGNPLVMEDRCYTIKFHPIATVFIPTDLQFISEL
jgi:hypothetical protein